MRRSKKVVPPTAIPLRTLFLVLLAGSCLASAPALRAQEAARVATYNVEYLDADDPSQRFDNLHEVIDRLDADVIGLQEIDDRAALERAFPAAEGWQHVIDDDSNSSQDVAVVVREPFEVVGFDADFDADDRHFLFPNAADNTNFPVRRDVLVVGVATPGRADTFFVMVVHAKSRAGGRANNDARREGHAVDLVNVLRRDFSDRPFFLLGDFNDNPDDRSLNILETGDPNAPGAAEEIEGTFLINLAEPLCAAGHVSFGRTFEDIQNGRINTIDPQSRNRNNTHRGTNRNTGDILFDQILIPAFMINQYVAGSARVFDHPSAVQGGGNTQASDHLPVSAEFVFDTTVADDTSDDPVGQARIHSVLPNPDGQDAGHEEFTIENTSDATLSLAGWTVRDRANRTFALSGMLPANARLTFVMADAVMPLNNSGDDLFLIDPTGNTVDEASYASFEATSGTTISFD